MCFHFTLGWCQDNGNRSNQESKFDFVATHQCLVKIDEAQQKINKNHLHQPTIKFMDFLPILFQKYGSGFVMKEIPI